MSEFNPYDAPHSKPDGDVYPAYPSQNLATASLVCGILSLVVGFVLGGCCGFLGLFGIPLGGVAVVTGHMARSKIRKGEAAGEGMALAGLVCGYISIVIGLVFTAIITVAIISGVNDARQMKDMPQFNIEGLDPAGR